jgi:hypothetical protein
METDSTGHLQRWGRAERRETFLQTFDWWLEWRGVLSRIDWERVASRDWGSTQVVVGNYAKAMDPGNRRIVW